jgi:YD repeat-containing protein
LHGSASPDTVARAKSYHQRATSFVTRRAVVRKREAALAAPTQPCGLGAAFHRHHNVDFATARPSVMLHVVFSVIHAFVILLALTRSEVLAQTTTTYHLHNQASAINANYKQLKTGDPELTAATIQSVDLKNSSSNSATIIQTFETQTGVPNVTGTIPAQSIINVTLWMRKTADFGIFHPHFTLHLSNYAGEGSVFVCWLQAGSSPVTMTLQPFALQCQVDNDVVLSPTDRFYMQVGIWRTQGPGNKSVKVELSLEGVPQGNYHSRIAIPITVAPPDPPFISEVSPQSGFVGTTVTVTGTNFGTSPGTLTFNGIQAQPTSWQSASIVTPVPAGATTGPVVVTTSVGSSAGVPFAVFTNGTLAGTISRASDATPIEGALVEALQSGVVKDSRTTGPSGTYSMPGLLSGGYDLRVTAAGFLTEVKTPLAVGGGATTTANVALSVAGQITGHVTDAGSTPLAGAAVSASLNGSQASATVTNANGDYTLAALHPGMYSVEASAIGYQPSSQSGVAVAEGSTAIANLALSAATAGPVTYAYDEVGRLVSVVDGSGAAATYTYDAVGNILSIARTAAGSVAIAEFTPNSGAIGSTVRIFGTGFSSTPAQNDVRFNGTAATVTSATATELAVTVQPGATTGTISVVSPLGSAASAGAFTVTAAGGPPAITGFVPSIGAAGTAVTITGINFQPIVSNNRVSFNVSQTAVSSATGTTLGTTVSSASTSGRLTVATPFGAAVSTSDFFVPPAPYTAADVAATARLPVAELRTLPLATAEKIGLAVFDADPSQPVSIDIGSTVSLGTIRVYSPHWAEMVSQTFGWGAGLVGPLTVPYPGTYAVLVDPSGTGTGDVNLTLHAVPPDWTGVIAIDGDTVTVPVGTPGQNARLTFTGTANQRVTLLVTNATIDQSSVAILNPDGSTLASTSVSSGSGYIDTTVLPAAGTYTVVVDPSVGYIGSMVLDLSSVPADYTGTISIGGSASVPNLVAGQNAQFTFTGTANQVVSVLASNVTVPSFLLPILRPDGTTLVSSSPITGSGFIEATILPTSGTYTLEVDPSGASTGSMTLNLYNVVDSTGTITAGGSSVTVDLPTPGQNGRRTFTGSTGQRISLTLSAGPLGTVSILKPDGTTLASQSMTVLAVYFDTVTLPTNGTYTILVDPLNAATGSVTLTLHNDVSGTVSINGSTFNMTISAPGQNGTVTFSGKTGATVTVRIPSNSIGSVTVRLLRPDATAMFSSSISGTWDSPQQTLPSTGTYRIEIDPSLGNTGTIQIRVTNPSARVGTPHTRGCANDRGEAPCRSGITFVRRFFWSSAPLRRCRARTRRRLSNRLPSADRYSRMPHADAVRLFCPTAAGCSRVVKTRPEASRSGIRPLASSNVSGAC